MIPSSIWTSATGILLKGYGEAVNHQPPVALTGLGVHVSMISFEFSNVYHWYQLQLRRHFTVLIITKEAAHE